MSILILDTETNRLTDPEPIEVGWLELDARVFPELKVVDQFYERYKPQHPISYGAMSTHHILPEEVEGCAPSASFALPEGTEYLIGHNIDFDWQVIGKPEVKRICTLALARRIWRETSHTQSALVYLLMESPRAAREMVKNAHNALCDVRICLFIVQHIIASTGATSIEDLYRLSEEARMPDTINFGKFKGTPINQMGANEERRGWVNWYLSGAVIDKDPYLVKALRLHVPQQQTLPL